MTNINKFNDVQYANNEEDTNIWQYCMVLPNALVVEFAMIGAGLILTKNVVPFSSFWEYSQAIKITGDKA